MYRYVGAASLNVGANQLSTQDYGNHARWQLADKPADFSTGAQTSAIDVKNGDKVFIASGNDKGKVYRYIGKDPLSVAANNLSTQDYTDHTKWQFVGLAAEFDTDTLSITADQLASQDYTNSSLWKLTNLQTADFYANTQNNQIDLHQGDIVNVAAITALQAMSQRKSVARG